MNDDLDVTIANILADLELVGCPDAPPQAAEWPDAKALCFNLGAAMKNQPGYRLGVAALGIVDLAYEFAVMAHLADLFRLNGDPVSKLAGPAVAQLRDICTAEGIRRGVVLAAGDDVDAMSLAVELMDEMIAAFTPGWAACR